MCGERGGADDEEGVSGVKKGGVFGCGKWARNDDGGYEATY